MRTDIPELKPDPVVGADSVERPIVVAGNPVDGFTFYGLFDSNEAAVQWAQGAASLRLASTDWWVAQLESPTE